MSLPEPIGGFFELELPPARSWLHSDAILLNSGRACLEYLIRLHDIRHILVPRFTCDVVLEPIAKLGVAYSFYKLSSDLTFTEFPSLLNGEYLLYTNYFGCMDRYCDALAQRYGSRLILDCSQALFFKPVGDAHVFYSPRKFVGVADGGCLYTRGKLGWLNADVSTSRYGHLLGRIDEGPEAAYGRFKANDASLSGEPLRAMSPSTRRLLGSIDYDLVKSRRNENYERIHSRLGLSNGLSVPEVPNGPMVYPFLSSNAGLRGRLIAEKVFVPTYWPNVLRWCNEDEIENMLTRSILPLPIDQRYSAREMDRILQIVASPDQA